MLCELEDWARFDLIGILPDGAVTTPFICPYICMLRLRTRLYIQGRGIQGDGIAARTIDGLTYLTLVTLWCLRQGNGSPSLYTMRVAYSVTPQKHYNYVIMGVMASQITSITIGYSTVYSGADQTKHQRSASLAFVWGIHRWHFPAQGASDAENVSIWWRHHGELMLICY